MCLYPKLIKNKKYLGYTTKKPKKGNASTTTIEDYRKQFVAIGCGHCIECRKQKAREWQVRLSEEITQWKYKYFITLTFSEQSLQKLCENENELTYNVNNVARRATRLFLERWRKKYKKSVKHWLITELGHNNTERIHLHGLLFTEFPINNDILQNIWKYGQTYTGDYCTIKTINYIVKYVTKIDTDHKGYEADIFCSAGIGACYYKNEFNKQKHKYNGKQTIQYYTLKNGIKVALPKYYRNKLFTQEERDKLWTELLDSDRTYVRGIQLNNISTKEGYQNYIKVLKTQQEDNKNMGYGNASEEWKEKIYKVTFDMLHANPTKKITNNE